MGKKVKILHTVFLLYMTLYLTSYSITISLTRNIARKFGLTRLKYPI